MSTSTEIDAMYLLADKITDLVRQKQFQNLPDYAKRTAISDAYRSEVAWEDPSDVDEALITVIIEFLSNAETCGVDTPLLTQLAKAASDLNQSRLNSKRPACDTTKRLVVEVWGEEVIHHRRNLIIEVPHDVTLEEIEGLEMSLFEDVPEPPHWESQGSNGISTWDNMILEVIDDARAEDTVDARLHRDEEGKLTVMKRRI